jgi:hypothetical protein
MSKQRLTDRLIASSIGLNDLIHIVNTGDTSQNPYGSSYKGTVQQLANAIGGGGGSLVLTTSGTSGPSTYIGNNLNVPNYADTLFSGGTVTGPTTFTNGLTATTISATTYFNLPVSGVTGGTGISANTTNGLVTIVNTSPDQTVTITGGTNISVNGTYPNFGINFTGSTGGGGGGQTFYLNLSQPKNGYRFLSTTASTASEQTSGVTINAGLTGTIVSFQTNPLNRTLLPGGIWSFYLHSYKQNNNASFNIFVEVYKRTSGGTETLLFATDPTPVTTNSPNPSMQLTDGYFSGTPLTVSDSIVAKVRATNTSNQAHIITLVTEGSTHYSYAVSTIPTQQGLTCDTLSGCTIIQTIQTNISNKYDKSGGTVSGNLTVNGNTSLQSTTASTVTVTNRSGTPSQVASFDTGGKLVAGVGTLGQTTYASYGTSTLTMTNATVGYQLIPGLTQTITVPNNCSVYVFTSGGMQNSNGSSNSFTVDIALWVDGVGPLSNGSFRRITTTNPNTVNAGWTSALWSMGALLNLSVGNHTLDVRAIFRNTSAGISMSGLISSDLTLNRQGELYIMIIKN